MSKQNRTTHVEIPRRHLTTHQKQERKQRLMTQATSSMVRTIVDAIVIKDGNVFLLTEPDGDIGLGGEHAFGLYYHDCRFLNGYELRVANADGTELVSTAARGFTAIFQLTNPDIRMANGDLISKDSIGIRWERTVDSERLALHDVITVRNFGLQRAEFPISLTFQAEFEPLSAVRGFWTEKTGNLHSPTWDKDTLSFAYDGADGLFRRLDIRFSPVADTTDGTTARYDISLGPQEAKRILVSLILDESQDKSEAKSEKHFDPDVHHVQMLAQRLSDEWMETQTIVHSDSMLLNHIIERSLRDLRMLSSSIDDDKFFAAGIPWFATLFGRDSIMTAIQTLAYNPTIAEQTLRLLARYQGQRVDDWRDEQPGKILHELRVGELARMGEIPYNPPYYGTVDATPLFLILVGLHADWTGDLSVVNDLRTNIDMAIDWLSRYGDANGDGYVEYRSASKKGLINQGWKDSVDAIIDADGGLARPPISLVEVQGYVYMAKVSIANVFRRVGEPSRADQLLQEAEELRSRFNRDFWLQDRRFYALALQEDGKPCAVISSNPGQALWTGIVDPGKAKSMVKKLMAPDMFNGWGIRTLSENEKRYNPVGYHLGTVWPHDNSFIASGLRQYGFDEEACRVFEGIVEAAMHFKDYRLPELFAGFAREDYSVPVRYPIACHPQAWASASIPHLLANLLGLSPEAFDHRLRIVRPVLPGFVDYLEVRRLRVGTAKVALRFHRSEDGVEVQVLDVEGQLEVIVETGRAAK